jgi:hypothetical protein
MYNSYYFWLSGLYLLSDVLNLRMTLYKYQKFKATCIVFAYGSQLT